MTAAIIATICIVAVLGLRHLRARQAAREHVSRRLDAWTDAKYEWSQAEIDRLRSWELMNHAMRG